MKNQVFKYLARYSTLPLAVDRLIVSAFLILNRLTVNENALLKSLTIQESDVVENEQLKDFVIVIKNEVGAFDFESLIELFEFVISPADRVVNGAIYTPLVIRQAIIDQVVVKHKLSSKTKVGDISCGCGGFLFDISKRLKEKTKRPYSEIFRDNIFGLDIEPYSVNRTKILLSLLAVTEGEDLSGFEFNLFVGDALKFHWDSSTTPGFDIILGNPPYVCSKHISAEVKLNIEKWSVSKSGHPDLYISFFQVAIESLSLGGILGFITMNSFFKSLNGRALREYFHKKTLGFRIIDFGSEQIFKSRNTYTCICIIENQTQDFVEYARWQSKKLPPYSAAFSKIQYSALDSIKGWNLQDNKIISQIESTGRPFKELYRTRHGIATLRNDVYIFRPVREDSEYYYLENGTQFPIEKSICRDVVNSNKLSRPIKIEDLIEKIIFPYNDAVKPTILEEVFFQNAYPKAYSYLLTNSKLLSLRDKGKRTYETWYAYGRTQSLEKIENKLFFPKYSDGPPNCILNNDQDLLFYNGLAIVGSTKNELIVIKKLLESKLFWFYIRKTSKPYSSEYYSLNGNYINNFGVCELSDQEKNFVINEEDREILDDFFEDKYKIKVTAD